MIEIKEAGEAVIVSVRVIPNSSKTEIVGEYDGALKIKIAAPPVEGAANSELIKFLAKKLKIPKNSVEITGGQNSKTKRIRLVNVLAGDVRKLV